MSAIKADNIQEAIKRASKAEIVKVYLEDELEDDLPESKNPMGFCE